MSDMPDNNHQKQDGDIAEQIGVKEKRKLRAREKDRHSIWFGLGMFGVVGWSVAVPVLIGIAIGCWLDSTFPSHISWCLTFLFLGVVFGVMIAWNWVNKESKPD